MARYDFKINEKNVVNDLRSRQTGNADKPFRELGQNSKDAGATRIDVTLTSTHLVVIDNGRGMNLQEIIDFYGTIGGGSKRNDEKSTGEFGVGRFQYFNLGKVTVKTLDHIIKVDLDDHVGYDILDADENFPGTHISIEFYEPLLYDWKIDEYIKMYKKSIIPPSNMDIYFNGKLYNPKYNIIPELTDDKYLVLDGNYKFNKNIYSNNIQVCYNNKTSFHYTINCKQKMMLNFARNEFIESDSKTQELYEKIAEIEKHFIKKETSFDKNQCGKILKLFAGKEIDYDTIKDKKIVPLTNGNFLSLEEVRKKEILFSEASIWSDDCIRQGYAVILTQYKRYIIDIKKNHNIPFNISFKDLRDIATVGFHRDLAPNSLPQAKEILFHAIEYLNDLIFDDVRDLNIRDIRLGTSDIANGWTDGHSYINIDERYVKKSRTLNEAIIKGWRLLCHEYSHDSETMKKDSHNSWFYEAYHKLTKATAKLLPMALKTITKQKILNKYMRNN